MTESIPYSFVKLNKTKTYEESVLPTCVHVELLLSQCSLQLLDGGVGKLQVLLCTVQALRQLNKLLYNNM